MKHQSKIEKVGLYARVSTKDGRQDTENQLIALREYCTKLGRQVNSRSEAAPENPVRGPGLQNADLMLGKTFRITERANLQFRGEVFNISNTPPFNDPNEVSALPPSAPS
jgi:hypothetical protein